MGLLTIMVLSSSSDGTRGLIQLGIKKPMGCGRRNTEIFGIIAHGGCSKDVIPSGSESVRGTQRQKESNREVRGGMTPIPSVRYPDEGGFLPILRTLLSDMGMGVMGLWPPW